MFDPITNASLLYDFYGQLLTLRQRDVMRLYHEENLSLSEIGEEFSISRQGVYDTLKNAEKALAEYEETLGLVRRYNENGTLAREAGERISRLMNRGGGDAELAAELTALKEMIEKMVG